MNQQLNQRELTLQGANIYNSVCRKLYKYSL